MNPTIIGVDLGWSATKPTLGLVAVEFAADQPTIIRTSLTAATGTTERERLLSVERQLRHLIGNWLPLRDDGHAVAYATPYLAANPQTLRRLANLEGLLLAVCQRCGVASEEVAENAAKAALGRDATDDASLRAVAERVYGLRRISDTPPRQALPMHLVDALGVALAAEAQRRRTHLVERTRP